MSNNNFSPPAHNVRGCLQPYLLLSLGVVFMLLAWIIHPSTNQYPIGILLFGVGTLLASALNPFRLVSVGFLITFLGIAVFLAFKHLIPGNQILSYYILAVGLALLIIALMARRGFIKAGAVTPALLVIIVGILEYLLSAGLTPSNFIPFMLSLWFPGIGLFVLGLVYLATGWRR